MDRQPKKSEKLEVRLPYGEKVRFLDRVTAHGQSVNQVFPVSTYGTKLGL